MSGQAPATLPPNVRIARAPAHLREDGGDRPGRPHHRHVPVDNDVKQAKTGGLDRWPSRHPTINVTGTQITALATNLQACLRTSPYPRMNSTTRPRNRCTTYPPT